jgi:large exoprotein involved in heme utilization and adhesion
MIRIRGQTLIATNSSIAADNRSAQNSTKGIDLQAGHIHVTSSDIHANAQSSGQGGSIFVRAEELKMEQGGTIRSASEASGGSGTINVQADQITISTRISDTDTGITTGIFNTALATGDAGPVTVNTGYLTISGNPHSRNFSAGISSNAGQISGQTPSNATGSAGSVKVTAGIVELQTGGGIHSFTRTAGDAGEVSVKADQLTISKNSQFATGISTDARTGSTGMGGHVKVVAGELELHNGSVIRSNTRGPGDAGTVHVKADNLLISGLGNTEITSNTERDGNGVHWSGAAGHVIVEVTGTLKLHDGGRIRSDTRVIGKAGEVDVRADRLLIYGNGWGGGGGVFTGISSSADLHANDVPSVGAAGNVSVTANTLELRNAGVIRTETRAKGNAGEVKVHAGHLLISNDGSRFPTGISSAATSTSTGNAGPVEIKADTVELRNGGAISTENASNGTGGSLTITTADTLRLDNATILTQTASDKGGNVTLKVGRLFDLHDSTVTTSVAGGIGSGGNIMIDPPLMVLDKSIIKANAIGGNGGKININAGQLIRTPDSKIEASSKEGLSGIINIAAPDTDVAGSLVALPGTFLDAASQLRETCASRGGRPTSSIIAGGRGGLPPDPGAPLVVSPFEQPPGQRSATGSTAALTPRSPRAAEPIMMAGIPHSILGSPRSACRG